jgi:lipopolysaccharide biosynthesis glycosyltransferase
MSKYAYVTILYGNNIYLTGALVLGYSLMKTNTPYDRIIMVTPDVSGEYKFYLRTIYTHVQEIEYIEVSSEIFSEENTRFRDVFTKLECLSLMQYDKIILLDSDMIIAKNMDHLFKLNAPAACLKKNYIPYGKLIPSNMICSGNKLVGSINAGLMLLKPDNNELENIKKDISKNTQLNKYKYPEQDYLSLRYCGKWTSISFNYNFQFGLTNRVKKCHYKINDIYVIHYSSSYKPWNDLIEDRIVTDDEIKFKEEHNKYYVLWKNAYDIIKEKYGKEGIVLPF